MARADNSKHLVPFKKGEDARRNKVGRPRKLPELEIIIADILGEEKDGVTAAQAILAALRSKAAKGDVRAAELLLDRAYGKTKQFVDLVSMGEKLDTRQIIIMQPDADKGSSQ